MYGGYLMIETNSEHPDLIRIRETASSLSTPPRADRGPLIRYAARFDDLSAARMHAHAALHRCLVDCDTGLYRCDVVTAVAAVEASELNHRRTYLDPELASDPALDAAVIAGRERHRSIDRIWRTIGALGVLLLLVNILLGL